MIRKYQSPDLDLVMDIWLETNIAAHDFISPDYWLSSFKEVKAILPRAEIYIYEENNTILAFIGLMDKYIAGIFVEPSSQSKGMGKQLLAYAKNQKTSLFLNVYQKNQKAVDFYLREGFVIDHEQIDENTGEIELKMVWNS